MASIEYKFCFKVEGWMYLCRVWQFHLTECTLNGHYHQKISMWWAPSSWHVMTGWVAPCTSASSYCRIIDPSHQVFWAYNPRLWEKKCPDMKNNHLIMSLFCTCNDSWVVMACAKLWYDWVIKVKIKAKRNYSNIWIMRLLTLGVMGLQPPWSGSIQPQCGVISCAVSEAECAR